MRFCEAYVCLGECDGADTKLAFSVAVGDARYLSMSQRDISRLVLVDTVEIDASDVDVAGAYGSLHEGAQRQMSFDGFDVERWPYVDVARHDAQRWPYPQCAHTHLDARVQGQSGCKPLHRQALYVGYIE